MIQPSPVSRKAVSPDSGGRRRKSSKVVGGAAIRPVQLTIFDYAASIGVALLPEAS